MSSVKCQVSSVRREADHASNTPGSDPKSPDDAQKGEGFLKSAWHKLMNHRESEESSNQSNGQGKNDDQKKNNDKTGSNKD